MELKIGTFLSFLILLLMSCGKFAKVETVDYPRYALPGDTQLKSFTWIAKPNGERPGSFKIEFKQKPTKVSAYTVMKCCGSQKKIDLTSLSPTLFQSESFLRATGDYTLYLQTGANLKDEAVTDFTIL